jgi:translation initiation factor 1A
MPRGVKNARNTDKKKGREVPMEEPGQSLYALVQATLGNGRMTVLCSDGSERLARVRGNMRRREWIRVGDMVLVGLRSFQEDKVDIVFKYTPAEVAQVQQYDPFFARLSMSNGGRPEGLMDEEDCGNDVLFADDDFDMAAI